MLIIFIGNNISIKVIILLTITEGIFDNLSGLKYDLLLNMSGLLALVGRLVPKMPSLPSASRVGAVSGLALSGYLFIEAC
jgi:hypothetical protein